MPRHNWRSTPTGQRWCADCEDFRPLEMFAVLAGDKVDNYCSFHRKLRRKISKRKYYPLKPITCPNCGHKFTKQT